MERNLGKSLRLTPAQALSEPPTAGFPLSPPGGARVGGQGPAPGSWGGPGMDLPAPLMTRGGCCAARLGVPSAEDFFRCRLGGPRIFLTGNLPTAGARQGQGRGVLNAADQRH